VRRWFVLLTFVIAALSLALPTSLAHSVVDYPAQGWKYSPSLRNRIYFQAPTIWPNGYNARTVDAMTRWNNLGGSGLTFSLAGDAASDSWSCGTSWDHLMTADLMSGTLASTAQCEDENSTARIRVNTDYSWYTGSSTPNPANQRDLQGVLTHELGHAHQAWGSCTDGSDDDPCHGMHFDSTYNGAICDSLDFQGYHTMCQFALGGTNGYRWRSTETHDEDVVEDMY
jgi:hypothetical protein